MNIYLRVHTQKNKVYGPLHILVKKLYFLIDLPIKTIFKLLKIVEVWA
jgi:hypothetical protein